MKGTVTSVYDDNPENASFHNISFIPPWEMYVSSDEGIRNTRTD